MKPLDYYLKLFKWYLYRGWFKLRHPNPTLKQRVMFAFLHGEKPILMLQATNERIDKMVNNLVYRTKEQMLIGIARQRCHDITKIDRSLMIASTPVPKAPRATQG